MENVVDTDGLTNNVNCDDGWSRGIDDSSSFEGQISVTVTSGVTFGDWRYGFCDSILKITHLVVALFGVALLGSFCALPP